MNDGRAIIISTLFVCSCIAGIHDRVYASGFYLVLAIGYLVYTHYRPDLLSQYEAFKRYVRQHRQ